MQDELNNFKRNDIWALVEIPNDHHVTGTKWVFKNKQDQDGIMVSYGEKQSKISSTRLYSNRGS